jgi:hypothetical protein
MLEVGQIRIWWEIAKTNKTREQQDPGLKNQTLGHPAGHPIGDWFLKPT